MKHFLVSQYFPYLALGVYGIEIKIPKFQFEDALEEEIGAKCEEWYNGLKEKITEQFGDKVEYKDIVSFDFKDFSPRDLFQLPFKVDFSVCVETELNQKDSVIKVAEFNAMFAVSEEVEAEFVDYIMENNFYFQEREEDEDNFSFSVFE